MFVKIFKNLNDIHKLSKKISKLLIKNIMFEEYFFKEFIMK